jgi:L-ectoine synthase
MIVRSLTDIEDTDRDIKTPNWRSKRIVLAKEKVGFSVHETTMYAGTINDFWYAHHVEAVFVVEGEGELLDKETGEVYQLAPGSLYLLDGHEHHQVRPRTQMRTVCVFNPPVTGQEVHDENGVYPLIAEVATDSTTAPASSASHS